jgi:putative membrane protein
MPWGRRRAMESSRATKDGYGWELAVTSARLPTQECRRRLEEREAQVAGMTLLPMLTLGALLSHWQFQLTPTVVALVALVVYGQAARQVAALGQVWPRRRTVAWTVGWLLFAVTTQCGIDVYGQQLFWVHMVEHLLLIMGVPLLLVLGTPVRLWQTARPREQPRRSILDWLTNPAVGLLLYTTTIVGTHLTNFMNVEMDHTSLAAVEQLLYVVIGTLFFLPLIGNEPLRWRLDAPTKAFVLVLAMPVDTFTGVVLSQASHYPWPAMAAMHPVWAPSLLADLHGGGAVMWIGGDAIMVAIAGAALVGWARRGHLDVGAGRWLESIRADRLAETTSSTAGSDSDDQLAAYNDYLARINQPTPGTSAVTPSTEDT